MDNRFNPYNCDGENSQACPGAEQWQFPLDEIEEGTNSQVCHTLN
jgi:hypothetical protein